jgi:hypothetical protein
MMPLRLTDSEMDIVMRAAQPLAVNDRDAFLQDVAKHLATLPVRGDGASIGNRRLASISAAAAAQVEE